MGTSDKHTQLTLDFELGLTERHTSLRDCIAAGVYQRGLGKVAIKLDKAPGNLSSELGKDTTRHLSVDSFEKYLETTQDLTPIYYLIEKFLSDKTAKQDAAQAQLLSMLSDLQPLLKQAGMAK